MVILWSIVKCVDYAGVLISKYPEYQASSHGFIVSRVHNRLVIVRIIVRYTYYCCSCCIVTVSSITAIVLLFYIAMKEHVMLSMIKVSSV